MVMMQMLCVGVVCDDDYQFLHINPIGFDSRNLNNRLRLVISEQPLDQLARIEMFSIEY